MPPKHYRPAIDATGRELIEHRTMDFPISCYHGKWQKLDVPWHWHQEWEIVYITYGAFEIATDNKKLILHAGEGLFLNSGVLHAYREANIAGCRFHSIVFHPRLVGGSLDSVFYRSYVQPLTDSPAFKFLPLYPCVPWQKSALEAIEDAWQACIQEAPGFPFQVRNFLSQLTYLLCSHLPSVQHSPGSKSRRDADRIKAMLSHIHSHYGSPLSTQAIAASASVSESECLRCFHATIGTTPIQYLKQYRIQQAAQSLLTTNVKISEIAEACGFQDMSYFTRTFRKQLGYSPSEYRKRTNL